MEAQVKDIKSGPDVTAMVHISDQMPIDPPSYPGPPSHPTQPSPVFVAVDTEGAAGTVVINSIGIEPVAMVCGVCNQRIVTRIERSAWFRTHFWGVFLCLFGCWPCVPIPYCTHVCKKAVHFCPNCDAYIGTQL